jgi:alpha-1,6-mannosyltransferase
VSLPLLTRRPTASTVTLAIVGVVGSGLVARASYVVGALPHHYIDREAATGPYRWPYEIGVGLLVLAWLGLGRLVLDHSVSRMTRRVSWAAGAMAAPLMVAAPVTSQDVWAYLGQANVAVHGLDPYATGPASAPGPYAHAVAHDWLHTGSPYGPLWLWICRIIVDLTEPHPWAGMFVIRVLAVLGIVATGIALVRLARATGARPEVALWLALAGPFPLLMLLGGLHNESVMLAFLVGGVAVAATSSSLRRALLLGALLVGAAAAIKVIALVALPFLPLVWWRYADPTRKVDPAPAPSLRRWVATGAVCSGVGVVVLLAIGLLSGLGLGWVTQVGDGSVGVSWLSATQQIGNVLHLLAPGRIADHPVDRYRWLHPLGLVLLALALAAVTLTARRRPPLRTLALATLLIVVSSPAPRTWYLLWPLVFLASDRLSPRVVVAVAAAEAAIALWFPASVNPQPPGWLLAVLFVAVAALGFAVAIPRPAVTSPPDRS